MTNSALRYRDSRKSHWDGIARRLDQWKSKGEHYHRRIEEIFRHIVPPGLKVLEIGCGNGDLLAALKPEHGVGVDFSSEMLSRARREHPDLEFEECDAHILSDVINEKFDVVILTKPIAINFTR